VTNAPKKHDFHNIFMQILSDSCTLDRYETPHPNYVRLLRSFVLSVPCYNHTEHVPDDCAHTRNATTTRRMTTTLKNPTKSFIIFSRRRRRRRRRSSAIMTSKPQIKNPTKSFILFSISGHHDSKPQIKAVITTLASKSGPSSHALDGTRKGCAKAFLF
jgi:hypothetical protein